MENLENIKENEYDQIQLYNYEIGEEFPSIFDINTSDKAQTQNYQTTPLNYDFEPKKKRTYNKKKKDEVFSVRNDPMKLQNIQNFLNPTKEDTLFINICEDTRFFVNPQTVGFLPSTYWPNTNIYMGHLVTDFFQRKNNINCRFPIKLYNALQITKFFPVLKWFTGVEWISNDILMINKVQFARLLGIHSIDGSLFHHQGNFTTHGFVELTDEEASNITGKNIKREDQENVKLLKHKNGLFVLGATEEDITECKWIKK